MTDDRTTANRWDSQSDNGSQATPAPSAPLASTALADRSPGDGQAGWGGVPRSAADDVATPPPSAETPAWSEPLAAPKPTLADRVRTAPRGAKVAAGGTAAVVALAGMGVGGFAVGRATAEPTGGQVGTDGGFVPGQAPPDGVGGFGGGDGQMPPGMPGQGTDPGTDSGTDSGLEGSATDTGTGSTSTTWVVVPDASTLLTT